VKLADQLPEAASARGSTRVAPARAASERTTIGLLAALYVVAAAGYAVLALRGPLPSLFPDEYRYAHLARGLADGTGFDWHGVHIDQTAALYVYFVAPAWALFGSTVDAYAATKVMGTLALCAQVLPVWLLGRELLGDRRLALLPAVLSVAGTWMLAGTTTATEALAYPLTTTALCFTVIALRRPVPGRAGVIALVFALLATWARIQLAVLIPVLLAAFALDLVRLPPARRAGAARARRPLFVAAGTLVVAAGVVALAARGATGDYGYVFDLRPGLGAIARTTGLQLLELVALGGFVPVLLAGAAALSRRAWRDDDAGPLLLVFWIAALATALQSGFYIASIDAITSGIDRYVAYALPLALVLAVLLVREPGLLPRGGFVVAGALGLTLLALPGHAVAAIERGVWSTGHRVDQVTGIDHGPAVALAAVALVALSFLGARAGRARAGGGGAAVALTLVVLGAFAVQGEAAWRQHIDLTRAFRAALGPDLEWVDHHSTGPVAFLGATQATAQFGVVDFFNRHVQRVYVPAGGLPGRVMLGGQCAWQIAPQTGAATFAGGCGTPGSRFYVDDPTAQLTFAGEARRADSPRLGHLVELRPGAAPRVRALLFAPCPRAGANAPGAPPPTCRPQLSGQLWLDAAARVVLRFGGGAAEHAVSLGSKTWTIAPGAAATTEVALQVPAGPSRFDLTLDWTAPAGAPHLTSARVEVRGTSTEIAYPAS
jgi:hypothetical protein